MKSFWSAVKRIARAVVSVALAGIPAYYGDNPQYLALAPILQGLGKWLRARFNLPFIPF